MLPVLVFQCKAAPVVPCRVEGVAAASSEQHQGAIFQFTGFIERDPQRDHRGDGRASGVEHAGLELRGDPRGIEADHAQSAQLYEKLRARAEAA